MKSGIQMCARRVRVTTRLVTAKGVTSLSALLRPAPPAVPHVRNTGQSPVNAAEPA